MYNVTQCKTPEWPPFCPFEIMSKVPCEIWNCEGPSPDVTTTTQSPKPQPSPEPSLNHVDVGLISGLVVGLFSLLALIGIGIYFKRVNIFTNTFRGHPLMTLCKFGDFLTP